MKPTHFFVIYYENVPRKMCNEANDCYFLLFRCLEVQPTKNALEGVIVNNKELGKYGRSVMFMLLSLDVTCI